MIFSVSLNDGYVACPVQLCGYGIILSVIPLTDFLSQLYRKEQDLFRTLNFTVFCRLSYLQIDLLGVMGVFHVGFDLGGCLKAKI